MTVNVNITGNIRKLCVSRGGVIVLDGGLKANVGSRGPALLSELQVARLTAVSLNSRTIGRLHIFMVLILRCFTAANPLACAHVVLLLIS